MKELGRRILVLSYFTSLISDAEQISDFKNQGNPANLADSPSIGCFLIQWNNRQN